MATFGIGGGRGTSRPVGNISVQSVSTPAMNTPSTVVGPSARVANASVSLQTMRTINASVVSPNILGNLRLPAVIRFIPPLLTPPKKQYQQDTLKVSQFRIVNSSFEPVEKNGISVFRPEIISTMDFKPIDGTGTIGTDNPTESAEQLVKAQYQAIELRAITLQKLMGDIRKKTSFRVALDDIKKKYTLGLASTKIVLKYFGDLIDKIDVVKDSLDPKKIPITAYDTKNYLSLIDFYERRMQYPKSKFVNFSDTKIINQIFFDFRNILEGYSLSLLDLSDSDRPNDFDPVVLDKTYTQTNGFSFGIASIRSISTPQQAFKPAFFTQVLNSLPANPDDRIKLLTHILSKELRVSKQLGKNEVARTLLEKYAQADSGNPFDNIVGTVGNSIFEQPLGNNSLATLTLLNLENNITVLPFESIYVDSENNNKTFVPGSTYFVDSILNISPVVGFNTAPFVSYANRFNEITTSAKSSIESLLELNGQSNLSPTELYNSFLTSMMEATAGLVSTNSINRGQGLMVAAFKLANKDTVLKNQLFEYLLLLGLCSGTRFTQNKMFERLATELGNLRNFSYVRVGPTELPDLNGGSNSLRPYLEGLATDIENRVFSLINTAKDTLADVNTKQVAPSLKPTELTSNLSTPIINIGNGSIGSIILQTYKFINSPKVEGYYLSFTRGELRETLINNITIIGNASTNICKEFLDLVSKFDQLASLSANQAYLLPDDSGRTRFNFLSTSTQMLLIFEVISSLTNKYAFAEFNKSSSAVVGSVFVDIAMNASVNKIFQDLLSKKNPLVQVGVTKTVNSELQTSTSPAPRPPFSLFNVDASKESLNLPYASGKQSSNNSSIIPQVFINGLIPLVGDTANLSVSANAQNVINTPRFGYGKLFNTTNIPFAIFTESFKAMDLRKSLVSNRTKLQDEDTIVKNILHILSVFNQRLLKSKETVVNTFTQTSINNVITANNFPISILQIVRNPAQVKLSSWILDLYDERTSDISNTDETLDNDTGFLITDRIPKNHLNALFFMLNQPKYQSANQADFKVKLLSVGIPAGFAQNLSDRVTRTAINETNFKDKQFDVIAVDVYKRDARYDDLMFKPQRFLFDLSLFPMKNFLPIDTNQQLANYSQVIQNSLLRDYQSFTDKRNVNYADIVADDKYSFLSDFQKQQMVQNHIESQLFDLYIKLMTGLKINEEVFTSTLFDKVDTQDNEVVSLFIRFLKEVKGKTIPNVSIKQLLVDPGLDQETKDSLRLLSYGNIVFQSSYVKNKILDPKLFDRVLHLPINIDEFALDVEGTNSTESGRRTYMKNSVQEQIVRTNNEEYLRPRERNDIIFEDYFVVVESNLRGGS